MLPIWEKRVVESNKNTYREDVPDRFCVTVYDATLIGINLGHNQIERRKKTIVSLLNLFFVSTGTIIIPKPRIDVKMKSSASMRKS